MRKKTATLIMTSQTIMAPQKIHTDNGFAKKKGRSMTLTND